MRNISLPTPVAQILQTLQSAGFSAYVVGGCVRDSLLGRTPGDWDICTSAPPQQIRRLFSGLRQVLTGEKHGTVAVQLDGALYEITTYRSDGAYTDHRHPDAVHFVAELCQDLARRDFTINAMAFAPGVGLVDLFGGQADLAAKTICAVGDAPARFGEDALRILRAARFAAQLDFTLEPATAAAAAALRDTIRGIAAERVYAELDKLLGGAAAGRVLAQNGLILAGAIPEILPCMGCTQPNAWHCYDVWQHLAATVAAADTTGLGARGARVLRWAALLHDLAKPLCRSVDAAGVIHFYGHNQRGAALAKSLLARLKAPAYLQQTVPELVALHDASLPGTDYQILCALGKQGPAFWQGLARLKHADLAAHTQNAAVAARRREVERFDARMCFLAQNGCYTLAALRVTGADALAVGIAPGPKIGQCLHTLLDGVMQGTLPNERPALLAALRDMT